MNYLQLIVEAEKAKVEITLEMLGLTNVTQTSEKHVLLTGN